MEKLRRPLFIVAYVALFVAIALEGGSSWFGRSDVAIADDVVERARVPLGDDAPSPDQMRRDMERAREANEEPPGYGIAHLALLDSILLLVMTWMLLSLVLPLASQVQGIITLIVALCLFGTAVIRVSVTFTKLIVMVSLLTGGPFAFAAYMAIWGFFELDSARWILAASMFLKIAFAVLLVLAHQQFLKVKSMLLIIGTSLVLTVVTVFLLRFVPPFMASITDAVAGIVNAIATAIWAVVLGVMSLISVRRAFSAKRALASSEGS